MRKKQKISNRMKAFKNTIKKSVICPFQKEADAYPECVCSKKQGKCDIDCEQYFNTHIIKHQPK